jgi:transcription elongation GreA/GreB family factor
VSKAFTKEDDDAGFTLPASSRASVGDHVRLTATGAARLLASDDPRVRQIVARAEVLPPQQAPERAALGVTVRVGAGDAERSYRLVSPEEQALTNDGVSVSSPLGRALLGAAVGDVRELRAPRGTEELEILELTGESPAR